MNRTMGGGFCSPASVRRGAPACRHHPEAGLRQVARSTSFASLVSYPDAAVIPELRTAVGALDEDEQRVFAESLWQPADDDDIEVTEDQKSLIRSRHEGMKADPTRGPTLKETRARLRELLA